MYEEKLLDCHQDGFSASLALNPSVPIGYSNSLCAADNTAPSRNSESVPFEPEKGRWWDEAFLSFLK